MTRKEILAPVPGTFYRQSAPGAAAFCQPGDMVGIDDVIGVVEIMKMFYEVRADVGGRVLEFAVGNEEAVAAGQLLLVLE